MKSNFSLHGHLKVNLYMIQFSLAIVILQQVYTAISINVAGKRRQAYAAGNGE